MMSWTPAPDPDRPNCPYFPGFTVEIEPHTPPSPFGTSEYPRDANPRPDASINWLEQTPPESGRAGVSALSDGLPTREIYTKITTHDHQERVRWQRPRPSTGRLLGYTFGGATSRYSLHSNGQDLRWSFAHYLNRRPQDICMNTDRDYSVEAVAYQQLQTAGLTGDFSPEFYGCYTFNLSLYSNGVKRVRLVRLILMGAVDGPSLRNMFLHNSAFPSDEPDGFHYPEEVRLSVMAKILDGVTRQIHATVLQNDITPRNVVIVSLNPLSTAIPRVVLVGYNRAIVFKFSKIGVLPFQKQLLPQNPMERWKHSALSEVTGWVPESWNCEEHEGAHPKQRWLEDNFGGDKASLYAPINDEDGEDAWKPIVIEDISNKTRSFRIYKSLLDGS